MGRSPRKPVKPSGPRKVLPLRPVVPKRIQPKPVPPRKVPLVRPELPSPWSDEDLSMIVEEACRFIAGVKDRIGVDLASEVGDYLFYTVYGGDENYIRRNDRSKQDSIRDIAKGCGIAAFTLRNWLEMAIVRHRLGQAGVSADLTNRHLRALYPLVDDIDAMAELVEWAQRQGASARELAARVQQLQGRKVTRPSRRGKRGRKRPSPDDLVIPRLLGVVARWLDRVDLTENEAEQIRQEVLAIEKLVR